MDLVSNGVDTEEQTGHESDEDEQAPAGTETIFADENLMESRRRRRWNWFTGVSTRRRGRGAGRRTQCSRGILMGQEPYMLDGVFGFA